LWDLFFWLKFAHFKRNFLIMYIYGQFHVRMWKIQIFKKWLDLKSYPVLCCWQVIVHRKISFSLLVIATHSGGVSKVSVYFLIINNRWETNF
jgi:hypothetical protein